MRLTQTRWVAIDCPPAAVFAMVADGARWPDWVIHNLQAIRPGQDGEWLLDTPRGSGRLRFTAQAEAGISDHVFVDAQESQTEVPARVVAAGDGAVFMMTVTKPDAVSDVDFQTGMRLLDEELTKLKQLLEAKTPASSAPVS
jgi:hypothetical protein